MFTLAFIDFPLAPSLIAALGTLCLSILLAFWNVRLQANIARHAGATVLRHSQWSYIIVSLLSAGYIALFTLARSDGPDLTVPFIAGLLIFGFIYLLLLNVALPFWAADETGLSRHVLIFIKTLPWQDIDWVYGVQSTSSGRSSRAALSRNDNMRLVLERSLIVEAGARRKIRIVMQAALSHNEKQAFALQKIIQDRATNAMYGFNRINVVRERRAWAKK